VGASPLEQEQVGTVLACQMAGTAAIFRFKEGAEYRQEQGVAGRAVLVLWKCTDHIMAAEEIALLARMEDVADLWEAHTAMAVTGRVAVMQVVVGILLAALTLFQVLGGAFDVMG
jgi:hypothetical protein